MIANHKYSSPLISILVPAYNQEKYLGRCIRSLLRQNFPREQYEIIAVNDGSTDKTSNVLNLFRDEILLLQNEVNCGLPASLNLALKNIASPYFVRVDADDYVSNNFLNYLYEFITQNSYMDAVACDYNLIDESGNFLERKNCTTDPIACGIIFKTDQIVDVGMYDEDFLIHEDRELRIRFEKKYKIHRLELPLYRYRRHNMNITNDHESVQKHFEMLNTKHKL